MAAEHGRRACGVPDVTVFRNGRFPDAAGVGGVVDREELDFGRKFTPLTTNLHKVSTLKLE